MTPPREQSLRPLRASCRDPWSPEGKEENKQKKRIEMPTRCSKQLVSAPERNAYVVSAQGPSPEFEEVRSLGEPSSLRRCLLLARSAMWSRGVSLRQHKLSGGKVEQAEEKDLTLTKMEWFLGGGFCSSTSCANPAIDVAAVSACQCIDAEPHVMVIML